MAVNNNTLPKFLPVFFNTQDGTLQIDPQNYQHRVQNQQQQQQIQPYVQQQYPTNATCVNFKQSGVLQSPYVNPLQYKTVETFKFDLNFVNDRSEKVAEQFFIFNLNDQWNRKYANISTSIFKSEFYFYDIDCESCTLNCKHNLISITDEFDRFNIKYFMLVRDMDIHSIHLFSSCKLNDYFIQMFKDQFFSVNELKFFPLITKMSFVCTNYFIDNALHLYNDVKKYFTTLFKEKYYEITGQYGDNLCNNIQYGDVEHLLYYYIFLKCFVDSDYNYYLKRNYEYKKNVNVLSFLDYCLICQIVALMLKNVSPTLLFYDCIKFNRDLFLIEV